MNSTLMKAIRTYLPGVILLVALLAAAVFLPTDTRLPMEMFLVLAMAQGWNLLSGYTGLLSFGHQVFVGLGAFTLFLVINTFGVSIYSGLLAAGVACLLASLAIAMILHGQRDAYFSIGIWVIAESVRLLFGQWEFVGSSRGMVMNTSGLNLQTFSDTVFWLSAALSVATMIGIYALLKSRVGLGLMAVRDNDVAAASVGVAAGRTKLLAFSISAAVCGLCGALYYLSVLYVDPTGAFDLDWQIRILFIVIIGGAGTLEGPIIGTLIYFGLREIFKDNGEMFLILQGVLAVVVMLFAPGGIWGLVQSRTGWQIFPTRWVAH